jgi:hypothetical protein
MKAAFILWTGPTLDPDTNKITWKVFAADAAHKPVATVYNVTTTFALAALLARRMSDQRRLPLVAEAKHCLGPKGRTVAQIADDYHKRAALLDKQRDVELANKHRTALRNRRRRLHTLRNNQVP